MMLAILVPLTGYLIVDHYGRDVIPVPRYYIPEKVDTIVKNGTATYDTTFHVVKDFTFTNQMGQQVSLKDLPGKVILVNFFFTSCPSICPKMMANLEKVQQAYVKNDTLLQLVSLTVDPERDSAARLKEFAQRFSINEGNWKLLTGSKKEIYCLARKSFQVIATDGDGGPDDFIHSDQLILMDTQKRIRGYYNGTEEKEITQLIKDIKKLEHEN